MAISAGETLSLNNLAGATGFTQSSNVSLGAIKGSPQEIIFHYLRLEWIVLIQLVDLHMR